MHITSCDKRFFGSPSLTSHVSLASYNVITERKGSFLVCRLGWFILLTRFSSLPEGLVKYPLEIPDHV